MGCVSPKLSPVEDTSRPPPITGAVIYPRAWGGAVKGVRRAFISTLNYFHREVCSGRIEIQAAQDAIAHDWFTAWKQMVTSPH
jgi:hypothetical protein